MKKLFLVLTMTVMSTVFAGGEDDDSTGGYTAEGSGEVAVTDAADSSDQE